jgi:outer membrane protein OmpA-like peptidoglycan-associated protein
MLALLPLTVHAFKVIPTILFARGSATLTTANAEIAGQLADQLIGHPEITLAAVVGHASRDDAKTEIARLDLSVRRAQVVADHMVARGVARDRLVIEGYGSTQPIDKRNTRIARDKNRRIDVVILKARTD